MRDSDRRNIADLRRDAETQSDKVLYKYLDAHIFGPFEGDCFAYLHDLKFSLRASGFERAKVCDDRGNSPPDDASLQEEQEFWWQESEEFLQNADVSIFVFLDYIFERPSLSERSRSKAHNPSDDPEEINSSVVAELVYWLTNLDTERNRILVLFEEGVYNKLGSLIPGLVGVNEVRYEKIPNCDISEASKIAEKACVNWAMGELRETLRERHFGSV